MKYYFSIILIAFLFSCKEKVESKLDFERLGVIEENRYTNPDYEFVKKEYPDSVLIEPGDVEFIVEIDSNINDYDSSIFSGVILVKAKLINHSNKNIYFLTEGFDVSSNVIEVGFEKIKIINCYGSDYSVCYYPKSRNYLKPNETKDFNFCMVVYESQTKFTLGYSLKLISHSQDLEMIEPYQYFVLKTKETTLSKKLIKKLQKRKSNAFDKYYLTDTK